MSYFSSFQKIPSTVLDTVTSPGRSPFYKKLTACKKVAVVLQPLPGVFLLTLPRFFETFARRFFNALPIFP